jgi:hypothetical protein
VRWLLTSNLENSGCASSAMNIVGTPYKEVVRSASIAANTAP